MGLELNAGTGQFDDGNGGVYNVRFPDVLTPVGPGARAALSYSGGLGGAAEIQHLDEATESRLVYFGFSFETLTSAAVRESCMFDVIAFFGAIPASRISVAFVAPESSLVTLQWSAIPGLRNRLQFKEGLADGSWADVGETIVATAAVAFASDLHGNQLFDRVVMVD